MNNAVHWASDYPLAIAMGHRKQIFKENLLSLININAGQVGYNAMGINLVYNF